LGEQKQPGSKQVFKRRLFRAAAPFAPVFWGHVLVYHATFRTVPDDLGSKLHNVIPDELRLQLRWLLKRFRIVSVDQYFESRSVRNRLCITFDDAYRCVMTEALPILIEMGVPCTVFVNGCTLEGKVFWRDKVRYILARGLQGEFLDYLQGAWGETAGMTQENLYRASKSPTVNSSRLEEVLDGFLGSSQPAGAGPKQHCVVARNEFVEHPLVTYGNHSHGHYVLSSLSTEEIVSEVVRTRDQLSRLGLPVTDVLALPFGGLESTTPEVFRALNLAGVRRVLSTTKRLNFRKSRTEGVEVVSRYLAPRSVDALRMRGGELMLRGILGPLI